MPVTGISEQGRATQGVKLIRIDEGDEIAAITQLNDSAAQNSNGEENSMESGQENNAAVEPNANATGEPENPPNPENEAGEEPNS
jgi:DNA gyrase subunit A